MTIQLGGCLHFYVSFFLFFKLTVSYRLCVTYTREDNDSNIQVKFESLTSIKICSCDIMSSFGISENPIPKS